jgi:hypothetical protein
MAIQLRLVRCRLVRPTQHLKMNKSIQQQAEALVSKALHENDEPGEQSIPDGTKVRFELKNISSKEFGFDTEEEFSDLERLDGEVATVDFLATATELGEKDYEYYTITFEDGTKLDSVSGYHLEPVEDHPDDDPNPIDDSPKCCPECDKPNQFGELCPECSQERDRIDHDRHYGQAESLIRQALREGGK